VRIRVLRTLPYARPLIYLSDARSYTVSQGPNFFRGEYSTSSDH